MKAKELLSNFSVARWGSLVGGAQFEVRELSCDHRNLPPGCVFIAIKGTKNDGHGFLPEVVEKNVQILVVEDATQVPASFAGCLVVVSDSRQALSQLANRFYGHPSEALYCVGVTGTNGKTTTTNLIESLLSALDLPTGVIGTIDHHLGDHVWDSSLTTPDPISFQKRLSEFLELRGKALALEVSSHALAQARVEGVEFDTAVFSNLTRDHLDFHGDMESYFNSKVKLFSNLLAVSNKKVRTAVVNSDDSYGQKIVQILRQSQWGQAPFHAEESEDTEFDQNRKRPIRVWTYGLAANADFQIRVLKQDYSGSRFDLKTPVGQAVFFVPMPGVHNVMNAAAAIAVAVAAGQDKGYRGSEILGVCQMALAKSRGVKGRLQAIPNERGLHVFVDYAHTDDALKSVLQCLDEIRKSNSQGNRIITVFGCGGDRDRGKRPLMLKAALLCSDHVVVTSDNPRNEDPMQIIRDICQEIMGENSRVTIEVDRARAISQALDMAVAGDVILIAGKGHEETQQIGDIKHPFSDAKVVVGILSHKGN